MLAREATEPAFGLGGFGQCHFALDCIDQVETAARRSSNDAIFACRPVGGYFDVGAGRLSLASATLISLLLRHSQRERGLTSCTAGETGQKPFSVLEDGCSRSVPQR